MADRVERVAIPGVLAALLRGPSRVALAVLAVVGGAVALDAFFIEPFRLEVTRVRVESPKLKAPLRIVVLADLQTDAIGAHEERAIRLLLDEKPDLILLAGDYLQTGSKEQPALRRDLQDLLRRLAVTLGALAVYRLGAHVPLAGIDQAALVRLSRGSGAALSIERISVLALGVGPIISALLLVEVARLASRRFNDWAGAAPETTRRVHRYAVLGALLLAATLVLYGVYRRVVKSEVALG